MSRREYKNAPIEEAIVEFRFAPGSEWDLTIPGKLHQHPAIKNVYPGKPRTQRLLQGALEATAGQPAAFNVQEGVGRIQLVDADAKRLVSLGPDLLSVHVLRPYEGWDNFRSRTDSALAAYREVAGVDSMLRIGLRYVNKIVVPVPAFDLDEHFNCGPRTIDGLPEVIANFLTRVDYVYDDGKRLIVTFAAIEAPQGSCAFLLDLDGVWEGARTPMDSAMSVVDELHERMGSAFERLITDKLREVFDAG